MTITSVGLTLEWTGWHRPLLSSWNQGPSSYERELEWRPDSQLEWQPSGMPPVPPLPPTFKERVKGWIAKLKEKLVRLWHWLPGRVALGMLSVWIFLAAFTIHMGGAYVSRFVDHPSQAFMIMLGLTMGAPLLFMPRLDRSPLGLGIVLNLLALLVMGLLTVPTAKALTEHGDWDVRWLESIGHRGPGLWAAKAVMSVSGWGIGLIPPDLIEQAMGPVDLTERKAPGGGVQGKEAHSSSPRTSASFGEAKPSDGGVDSGDPNAVPTPTEAEAVQLPGNSYLTKTEKKLSQLFNQERIREGLEAIRLDERLSRVAQTHSKAMLSQGFFDHVGKDGRSPSERVSQVGLAGQVDEALLKVEASAEPSSSLKLAMLADANEKQMLMNPDSGLNGMGIGVACDASSCVGTILFLR